MATKRNKRSGLGEPEVEGYEAMFEARRTTTREEPQEEPARPSPASRKQQAATAPEDAEPEDEKARMVKTSIYLSQEAHDLLHLLKFRARQSEGRHVSIGELLDTAVRDLAKKRKIAVDQPVKH